MFTDVVFIEDNRAKNSGLWGLKYPTLFY